MDTVTDISQNPGSDCSEADNGPAVLRDGRAHATGVFGKLKVRLDPWQPEFGPEFAGMEDQSAEGLESLDIELEQRAHLWAGIDPAVCSETSEPVWFIDGVRRLEARVTAKLGDNIHTEHSEPMQLAQSN